MAQLNLYALRTEIELRCSIPPMFFFYFKD